MDLERWEAPYATSDYYENHAFCVKADIPYFIKHRVKKVLSYKNSGSCVDLGCGSGHFAIEMAAEGFSVHGVEESPRAIKFLEEDYPLVRWHCQNINGFLQNSGEQFDIIALYHVLEHIPHPAITLTYATSKLKEGGVLVIEVPDVCSGRARFRGWAWEYWLPHHVNYFSLKTLTLLTKPLCLDLLEVERKYHFCWPQGKPVKDTVHSILAKLGFYSIITTYWIKR
jgi:SAM-dependent methyltransferase